MPIAVLPKPGADLVARQFALRGPSGSTPIRPAVEGALTHLRKHLLARPDRRGFSSSPRMACPRRAAPATPIPGVVEVVTAARTGAPPISTYVVGIATPNDAAERAALQMVATAGGTAQPIIIGPMDNLGQGFLDALNQIRGESLPCDFAIPPPRAGGTIDFGKVNVRRKAAAGDEDVLYASNAAACNPAKGGWHYDVDPASGTPTRVVTCPATCQAFKANPAATIEIRFGCRTRVVD